MNNLQLGNKWVIKFFAPKHRHHFEVECQMYKILEYLPGIPRILSTGTKDRRPFIVMERMSITLEDYRKDDLLPKTESFIADLAGKLVSPITLLHARQLTIAIVKTSAVHSPEGNCPWRHQTCQHRSPFPQLSRHSFRVRFRQGHPVAGGGRSTSTDYHDWYTYFCQRKCPRW